MSNRQEELFEAWFEVASFRLRRRLLLQHLNFRGTLGGRFLRRWRRWLATLLAALVVALCWRGAVARSPPIDLLVKVSQSQKTTPRSSRLRLRPSCRNSLVDEKNPIYESRRAGGSSVVREGLFLLLVFPLFLSSLSSALARYLVSYL